MKKHLLFGALLVFALSISSFASGARAAVPMPLTGWAWSSNTGWLSFNSATVLNDGNTLAADYGGTYCSGGPCAYAVNISTTTTGGVTTGTFSGYAWSPNIGWVSFNASDVAAAPACGPAAQVVYPAGETVGTVGTVTGWVRALSGVGAANGWDGCIQLSDNGSSPLYHDSPHTLVMLGVTYQIQKDPISGMIEGIFNGFAWDSGAIGWLSFAPGVGLGGVIIPTCTGSGCGPTPGGPSVSSCSASPSSLPNSGGTISLTANISNIPDNTYKYQWFDGLGNTSDKYSLSSGNPTISNSDVLTYGANNSASEIYQYPGIVIIDSSSNVVAYSSANQCGSVGIAGTNSASSVINLLAYKSQSGTGAPTISIKTGQDAWLGWTPSEDLTGYTCTVNVPSQPSVKTWSSGVWQTGLTASSNGPIKINDSNHAFKAGTYQFNVSCSPPVTESFDMDGIFSSFVKHVYAQGAAVQSNDATIIVKSSSEGEI